MEKINNALELIPEERIRKILIVAELEGKSPARIIHDTTVTSLSLKSELNLKDYHSVWLGNGEKISAYSGRLKIAGKKAWKDGTHGMPDNIEYIYKYFDEEEVNKNILENACRLIEATLDNTFENGSTKTSSKYRRALSQPNFIYMMLRLSIRLLAEDLRSKGHELNNRTLQHMTDMIKKDKKKIKESYMNASTEGDLETAHQLYYETLNKYFDDFMERKFEGTGKEAFDVGSERKLLEYVGEETVYIFLGYLCGEIKKKYPHQLSLQGFYNIER